MLYVHRTGNAESAKRCINYTAIHIASPYRDSNISVTVTAPDKTEHLGGRSG